MKFYEIQGLQFTTANIVLESIPQKSIETGEWESSEIQLIKKYLKPEDTVLELGACIGVVSCVTNAMLDNPEHHVVVEANPKTAKVLEINKRKNGSGFAIENCLVFRNHSGKFYPASGAPQSGSTIIHNDGRTSKKGKENPNQFDFDFVQLPVVTIEHLEGKHHLRFNTLIMDIEGGEFQFIQENIDFISKIDLAIIEFHHRFDLPECDQAAYDKAASTLKSCGLVELKNVVTVRGRQIETATECWGRP